MSRSPRKSRLWKRHSALPGVMLAPLIDLVLTLLIFFMLVSRYLQPTVDLTLPESRAAAAETRPSVTLTLTAEGDLYYEGEQVNINELAGHLAGVDPQQVETVVLQADEQVPLKRVVEVLDVVRASPLKSVALEVRPK